MRGVIRAQRRVVLAEIAVRGPDFLPRRPLDLRLDRSIVRRWRDTRGDGQRQLREREALARIGFQNLRCRRCQLLDEARRAPGARDVLLPDLAGARATRL